MIDFAGNETVREHKGRILKQKAVYDKRYDALKRMTVVLSRGGERKYVSVHTLVMEAFVGPRPKGMEIAHNTNDPAQNAVEQLRYATHRENCQDRRANGTEAIGERNPAALLKDTDIPKIRTLIGLKPLSEIATMFGVQRSTIGDISRGKTWRHV